MKKLLLVVALVVAGLVIYNVVTTGTLRLLPSAGSSDEERSVAALESQLEDARTRVQQAHRTASVAGLDTTADIESARSVAARIGRELTDLRARLTDERALQRADDLARQLHEFEDQLR